MITISNLNFAYGKRSKLFDKLDLSLASGHIYGLLGKNGTGKSTLINLISGFLFPQEGTIDVQGYTPGKRQVPFLEDLFLVPEELDVPDITPAKYAKMYASFYPKFDNSQYNLYLKEFDIDPTHALGKMSMGQLKKAVIAFALACNTKLLLMDEPTNGLDIPSKTQFRRLLASVASDDRCILISTHQVRDLENLIDTIVILENNRIVFNQPTDVISNILGFTSYNGSEKPESSIYDEAGIMGSRSIVLNRTNTPSRLDIELLFNAIVSDKGEVTKLFSGQAFSANKK